MTRTSYLRALAARLAAALTVVAMVETLLTAAPVQADSARLHTLSISVLDRAGEPFAGGTVFLVNPDTGGTADVLLDADGRAARVLPEGYWAGLVKIMTPARSGHPASETLALSADLNLTTARSMTVDARRAVRVEAPTVRGRNTRVADFGLQISRTDDNDTGSGEEISRVIDDVGADHVYITPLGPPRRGILEQAVVWRLEPARRTPPHGPDAYVVMDVDDRLTPGGKVITPADEHRMARVVYRRYGEPGSELGVRTDVQSPHNAGMALYRTVAAGSTETDLVTASPDAAIGGCVDLPVGAPLLLCRPLAPLQPGKTVTIAEGRALHADPVPQANDQLVDAIDICIGLGDGTATGMINRNLLDHVRTTIYRDGEQLVTAKTASLSVAVPGERAHYRVVSDIGRHDGARRTDTLTTWSFTSSAPDPSIGVSRLPMLTVDYGPNVASDGTAPRGRALHLRSPADQSSRRLSAWPDCIGTPQLDGRRRRDVAERTDRTHWQQHLRGDDRRFVAQARRRCRGQS